MLTGHYVAASVFCVHPHTADILGMFSDFVAEVLTWPIAGAVVFTAVCTRLCCSTDSERLPE